MGFGLGIYNMYYTREESHVFAYVCLRLQQKKIWFNWTFVVKLLYSGDDWLKEGTQAILALFG